MARRPLGASMQVPSPWAISVAAAASELGISKRHVERLVATGHIPSLHLGRRRLIPVESLYRYLEALVALTTQAGYRRSNGARD